jgi:galactokinase
MPSLSVGRAPGRVNLIGEHTDYNDGLVLPVALDLLVTVTARERPDDLVHLVTDNAELAPSETTYARDAPIKDGSWADRVRGLTEELRARGATVPGFDATVSSSLPPGAGLGSSAAFTIAFLRALDGLVDLGLNDEIAVDVAHAVENGPYVGARAGLLDQLASVYGRQREALLIDMRDRSTQLIALPGNLEIAVIDSATRHDHASGGYNTRRAECEAASAHLGVVSLRELEGRSEDDVLDRLPPPLDRRVRHVLRENARVREAVTALREDNTTRLGELLRASHRSLRDDYEVSTAALDRLVTIADADADVLGARLVGGGFGGSVLALTTAGHAREAGERIAARYGAGRLIAVVP